MLCKGRTRFTSIMIAFTLIVLTPALCLGADVEGSKDSPLLKRYEGSFIVKYSMSEFDSTVIPLGPIAREDGSYKFTASRKEEGRTTRLLYLIPEGRSSLEILRNYEGELKAGGYEILFSGSGEELGPYDSFAETLYGRDRHYPIPGDQKTKKQQFLSARLARPAEGDVYVTVCTLENHFWGSETKLEKGRTYARVDIIEVKPMEAKMVVVTSEEMAKGIEKRRKASLHGYSSTPTRPISSPNPCRPWRR